MNLTKKEREEALTKMKALVTEGLTPTMVMEKMGLSASDYSKLREQMIEREIKHIRNQSNSALYAEYTIQQYANIHDLSKIIDHLKGTKQFNAIVGAVKARADIMDRIIAKGQEFGLINKEPERFEGNLAVGVGGLTNEQLRARLQKQADEASEMISKYGGVEITDIEPGPVHYRLPPKREKAVSKRTAKSRRNNKSYRGRKVIKQKAKVPKKPS